MEVGGGGGRHEPVYGNVFDWSKMQNQLLFPITSFGSLAVAILHLACCHALRYLQEPRIIIT